MWGERAEGRDQAWCRGGHLLTPLRGSWGCGSVRCRGARLIDVMLCPLLSGSVLPSVSLCVCGAKVLKSLKKESSIYRQKCVCERYVCCDLLCVWGGSLTNTVPPPARYRYFSKGGG